MTVQEAADRLRAMANGTINGDELRAFARDLYGKGGEREVDRLLSEAGYLRIARLENGRLSLETAYRNRLRRDYEGPLTLDGVELNEGPDVVAVNDGGGRWFIAPQGAVMRLNHWLSEQSSPEQESEQPA